MLWGFNIWVYSYQSHTQNNPTFKENQLTKADQWSLKRKTKLRVTYWPKISLWHFTNSEDLGDCPSSKTFKWCDVFKWIQIRGPRESQRRSYSSGILGTTPDSSDVHCRSGLNQSCGIFAVQFLLQDAFYPSCLYCESIFSNLLHRSSMLEQYREWKPLLFVVGC